METQDQQPATDLPEQRVAEIDLTSDAAVQFVNRSYTGAAEVQMARPFCCSKCGGSLGYQVLGPHYSGDVINPERAQLLLATLFGYLLGLNRDLAARGAFRHHDSHDASPDDWQFCRIPGRCVCDEPGDRHYWTAAAGIQSEPRIKGDANDG